MPEDSIAPGIAPDGISGDIFGTPSGAAWDAAKLIFGDWLELVFNDVGSGSATIMTHVAGYINFLAYVLIVVIMSYVLIAAVIKTAAEGKVMGNGWSTVWLPLRTFLACFLIFPVGIGQASTISFIQVAVAWLGMVGSNAADRVAGFVVENLTKRAFRVDAQIQGYQAVTDMTKMAFCASGFNSGLQGSFSPPSDAGENGFYGRIVRPSIPDGVQENVSGVVDFLYGENSPNSMFINAVSETDIGINGNNMETLTGRKRVQIGHRGHCGVLSRPEININGLTPAQNLSISRDAFKIIISTQINIYNNVVGAMKSHNYETYMDLLEVSNLSSDASEANTDITDSVSTYFKAISDYERNLTQLLLDKLGEGNDFIEYEDLGGDILVKIDANKYSDMGWGYLGAYYTLLSKAIGEVTEVSKTLIGVTTFNPPNGCQLAKPDGWSDPIGWAKNLLSSNNDSCLYEREYKKNEIIIDLAGNAITSSPTSNGGVNELSASCTSLKNCSVEYIEKKFAGTIGKPFFEYQNYLSSSEGGANNVARNIITHLNWGNIGDDSIMGLREFETGNGETNIAPGALFISDPITFTSNLGHTIVYTVAGARLFLGVLDGVAEAGKNTGVPIVGAVSAGLGAIVQATADFLRIIIALIYPQAAAMAYFLPLLPSLIWAMAFLSWLLMYAEAIFNAPLAVTLMATPEGEGIAGSRMERKIALLAALILKPAFLVVGLLLSMMMLSIGFVFLNQVFWISAANVTWQFDPIAVVALISIWFGIITVFMHNVFKIIPTFADNSLEWFLGGIARTFGNNMDNVTADQFQNSFKGSSDLSHGLGKSVGVLGKGIGNSIKGESGKGKNNESKE